MSDETNHELLSAYLDGELTADERQRVEQLLAESAECRQVYDELRALRTSLISLATALAGRESWTENNPPGRTGNAWQSQQPRSGAVGKRVNRIGNR